MVVVTRFHNGAIEFMARNVDSLAQKDGVLFLFGTDDTITHKWSIENRTVHAYSDDGIKFNR